MRKIQPGDIHPRLNEAREHIFGVTRRPDRCNDLGSFCGSRHRFASWRRVPTFTRPKRSDGECRIGFDYRTPSSALNHSKTLNPVAFSALSASPNCRSRTKMYSVSKVPT